MTWVSCPSPLSPPRFPRSGVRPPAGSPESSRDDSPEPSLDTHPAAPVVMPYTDPGGTSTAGNRRRSGPTSRTEPELELPSAGQPRPTEGAGKATGAPGQVVLSHTPSSGPRAAVQAQDHGEGLETRMGQSIYRFPTAPAQPGIHSLHKVQLLLHG